jgi:hypothetical protein
MTDKADGKLEVFVNHRSAGTVTINPNKEGPTADSSVLAINLKAGLNMLRLNAPAKSSYQLNSIKVIRSGQPLKNTLPMFDLGVWDEEVKPGEKNFVRDFRVHDAETPADNLLISATSDNPALLPDANIKIESGEFKGEWGNVYNRRLTVTPAAGQKGSAAGDAHPARRPRPPAPTDLSIEDPIGRARSEICRDEKEPVYGPDTQSMLIRHLSPCHVRHVFDSERAGQQHGLDRGGERRFEQPEARGGRLGQYAVPVERQVGQRQHRRRQTRPGSPGQWRSDHLQVQP